MKKFIIILSCSLLLIISIAIVANAKVMKAKIFRGESDTVVTLRYAENDIDSSSVSSSGVPCTNQDNYKVGDIIFENGVKQVVIAVSDDGAYIAQLYDDYIE